MSFIIITGGSGFVGRTISRGLRKAGHRVKIFDRVRGPMVQLLRSRYFLTRQDQGLRFKVARRVNRLMRTLEAKALATHLVRNTDDDILDVRSRIAAKFRGFDTVIHLAALPHPYVPGTIAADFLRINYEGAINVFEAARDVGVKKFIFASSVQVYQINQPIKWDQFPILENNYCPTQEEGQTAYGDLKLKFEAYLETACRAGDIEAIALRLEFPGVRSTSAKNLFISTSVENLGNGFACAVRESPSDGYQVFNLADAEVDPRVVDIQAYLRESWPSVPNFCQGNQCLLSTVKAQQSIGYQPKSQGRYIDPLLVW